jgi:hypothetical protein
VQAIMTEQAMIRNVLGMGFLPEGQYFRFYSVNERGCHGGDYALHHANWEMGQDEQAGRVYKGLSGQGKGRGGKQAAAQDRSGSENKRESGHLS